MERNFSNHSNSSSVTDVTVVTIVTIVAIVTIVTKVTVVTIMVLKDRFKKEIVPKLMKELGVTNLLAVPRPLKIVVNMGIGEAKDNKALLEEAQQELSLIAGQYPNVRRAHRSEAGWTIRAGDPIGLAVTLRRDRMWGFLNKLIRVALPRVRDFRGLNRESLDGRGNFSIGFGDHTVFSEMVSGEVVRPKGLEVTIVMDTDSDEKAYAVLKALGMPFRKD